VTFVDKAASRDYCRSKSSTVLLPKVFQLTTDPGELDPSVWPEECVIKPTHGSGALIMVTKKQEKGLTYNFDSARFGWAHSYNGMTSTEIDVKKIRDLSKKWLESNYEYWTLKFPEWAYRHVPRQVLVEELIRNSDGSKPAEVRLHCFHGKVALFRITNVISSVGGSSSFNSLGEPINARLSYEKDDRSHGEALPSNWREAIREAELISKGIDYLRVDLYLTDRGVYFSELTPYTAGGIIDFKPRQISKWLAGLWGQSYSAPKNLVS